VIADKHEETMGTMGAILAAGILDAGGRNVTIALRSRSGHDRVTAVVGMAVFTQWWYWYPLVYFLSLTFAPTALIGLNANLQMPRLDVSSAARPSLFAYPAPLSDKKEEEVKKVPTAQLSTTARAKSKAKKDAAEKAEKGKEALDKVVKKEGGKKEGEKEGGDAMEVDKEPEAKKVKKEKEPESELLSNPARVVPAQEKHIRFLEGSQYAPLKKVAAGWVLLKNLK
jgi:26S proteasome regulatory subunit N2